MIERERNQWVGLAAGATVSLLAHAGIAWWLVGSAHAGEPEGVRGAPEQPDTTPPPIELGRIDTSRAAIAWLGVETDPFEGDAPESEVDQAALSPLPGVESLPTPPPVPEQTVPQTEPSAETSPTTEPEPQAEPEPRPVAEPVLIPEPEVEPAPQQPTVTDAPPPGPSLVAEPNPVEPVEQEPAEPPAEPEPAEETPPEDTPAQIVGPPAPPADRPAPAPEQTEPPRVSTPATAPGEPAEMSERQADAARKEAINYDSRLNRPLAAAGLEIKTVRPEWPALVRQSFSPRDPIVVIRFGADGKVRRADFLRETNGRKGTGIQSVDGPIIDAVYRWTAKGSRIDALDKNDPRSEIVISIRILLGARRVP